MRHSTAHHFGRLCVGVPVQLGDDQALRQTGSLGRIDGIGDHTIQINALLMSWLSGSAWRRRVTSPIS